MGSYIILFYECHFQTVKETITSVSDLMGRLGWKSLLGDFEPMQLADGAVSMSFSSAPDLAVTQRSSSQARCPRCPLSLPQGKWTAHGTQRLLAATTRTG